MLFKPVCFYISSYTEKWTYMWLNEKTHKMLFQITCDICFNDVTKQIFLNAEGLQILILGIFTTQMLHKQYKSLHVALLERLFILLAI